MVVFESRFLENAPSKSGKMRHKSSLSGYGLDRHSADGVNLVHIQFSVYLA